MSIEKQGNNCIIGDAVIGKNAVLGHNCIIEDDVTIGDDAFIDCNTIIRTGVKIGNNAFIGANCIIGEYQSDFCQKRQAEVHPLTIGDNALIRSGSFIYSGSDIGSHFQTGHQVTIREKSNIGNNVSVGTLSDIQGNCSIGSYVRIHSNVHIGQLSVIDNYVWMYPYVVLTNDPTPPSDHFAGVHMHSFAVIATGSIIMPGLEIGQDALIGAGAIVTNNIEPYAVALGNPARAVSDVRNIKNKITGNSAYPWREHFDKYMPWEGIGFEKWYSDLNELEKENLSFTLEMPNG